MEYQLEMEDFPTMMKKEHIEMIQKAAAAVKAKETAQTVNTADVVSACNCLEISIDFNKEVPES